MSRQPPGTQGCDQYDPGQAQAGHSPAPRGQIGVFGTAALGFDPAVDGGWRHRSVVLAELQDGGRNAPLAGSRF